LAPTTPVDQLRLGDHVCWGFDDDEARLDIVTRFVAAGQRDGHRILCLTEPVGLRLTGCRPEIVRLLALVGGDVVVDLVVESS